MTVLKKLIIALILVFVFCSCGVFNPVIEEPAPGEEISSSEEEISSNPEQENSENNAITEADLTEYVDGAYRLEEMGISQHATNVVWEEDGSFTFDLVLKKGDSEITENFKGYALFSDNYGSQYEWGGYSLTSNGHLVICGINKIVLINPVEFSVINVEFKLEELAADGCDLWINGVIFDENNENWIVSAAEGAPNLEYPEYMPWRIFVFDMEGKLLSEYSPKASALYGGWADFATPYVAPKCAVLNKDGKTYYSFGARCYCVQDGKSYQGSPTAQPYDAKTGRYSVYFYHCYDMDFEGDGNGPGKDLGFYAVLKEHENIHSFFSTGREYMDVTWNEETGKQTLELIKNDGLHFTLKNSYLAKTIELDFEKGEYSVRYDYTDENLAELIDTSADGNYSLWKAGVQSGGESYFYDVALKNNKTGKITRIEPNGTNVGGFFSEGFLRNGDFYVYSSSGLKIYDPETVEMIFDLDKNFPMEDRLLYTFRRNPEDFSYIVVYSDSTREQINEGWASEDWKMPFCFKVAYLDKEGNLIKSFESNVPVMADFFGIEGLEMRYSEDLLLFVTTGGKGLPQREFTFDRKTETFSEASEAE